MLKVTKFGSEIDRCEWRPTQPQVKEAEKNDLNIFAQLCLWRTGIVEIKVSVWKGRGVGGGGRNIKLSNEIPNLHTTRPQTTEEGKKIHIQRCCWSNSPAPKLSYYVLKHCWLLIHTNPKVGRNYIDVLCYNFSDTWQKMISRKSCNKDGKWNNWK